jgi:hypothetical protein
MVFIFLLFSMFATIINAFAATFILKLRAKTLRDMIKRMLDDDQTGFGEAFFKHPLMQSLQRQNGKLPSYIKPEVFSKVFTKIVTTAKNLHKIGEESSQKRTVSITNIDGVFGASHVSHLLHSFVNEGGAEMKYLEKRLVVWFDLLQKLVRIHAAGTIKSKT